MIGVKIEYEGNTLLMSLPTDELYDHLGSIGITKDIPVGGTENMNVKIYADNDLEISKTVCGRLLPDNKISRINELCEQIESAWRVGYTDEQSLCRARFARCGGDVGDCFGVGYSSAGGNRARIENAVKILTRCKGGEK